MHHVLGVHPDEAMRDFLLTNEATKGRGIPGNSGQDRDKYAQLSEAASRALMGVSPEYLDAAFAAMREANGSVDAYLEEVLDVDRQRREKLREALIEG
jgi:protein tyrosine/serine phosphatase